MRMAYGLPDTRESLEAKILQIFFISGDHRGMASTNQVGLMAANDLLRKGLVDPNMYMKLFELIRVSDVQKSYRQLQSLPSML